MIIENNEYDDVKHIEFPLEIEVSLAVCSKKCGYVCLVVPLSRTICCYCEHEMKIVTTKKYYFDDTKKRIM